MLLKFCFDQGINVGELVVKIKHFSCQTSDHSGRGVLSDNNGPLRGGGRDGAVGDISGVVGVAIA